MTATNHAITGALIGLSIGNPVIALPLAFASHFVLDAIPHYDPPGDKTAVIGGRHLRNQLILDASLCVLLVISLVLTQPQHWLVAAFSAFIATSPDLFWIPEFIHVHRTGALLPSHNWFLRFHGWVQWRTGPELWWVEAIWYGVFGGLLITRL